MLITLGQSELFGLQTKRIELSVSTEESVRLVLTVYYLTTDVQFLALCLYNANTLNAIARINICLIYCKYQLVLYYHYHKP